MGLVQLSLIFVAVLTYVVATFLYQYSKWNCGVNRNTGLPWKPFLRGEVVREYRDMRGNACTISYRWVDHPEERPEFLRNFLK